MTSANSSALRPLTRLSRSRLTYPMIEVSGVRNSCETRAMNSSFSTSSSRRRSFWTLSCSVCWVRACSAMICGVTSRVIPNVPMIFPKSSTSGILVVDTQASSRPLKVSISTFPTIGSPLRMICCSSSKAAVACCSLNTSKSVLPTSSSAARSGVYASSQPLLTNRNRLIRSLK